MLIAIVIIRSCFCSAQHVLKGSIDALHYKYEIWLNDRNDSIEVTANLKIKFLVPTENILLDLYGGLNNKGMTVEYVGLGEEELEYIQNREKLNIRIKPFGTGCVKELKVQYKGIPQTGLVITSNMYGDRVFFADCWPNRAHHWLCCIDDPADKALVDFIVHAPSKYQVVSNGELIHIEKKGQESVTYWNSCVPIPTKVMVIGVARFSIDHFWSDSIPVSSWVYPQDEQAGFYDYRLSVEPLNYYSQLIGPYPFTKLANVQSTTEYGGMENASCIFYSEESIRRDRSSESLLAHEISHQWFGNTVTEVDFYQIWLSEGFATYLTNMYFENKYGRTVFAQRLRFQRKAATSYIKSECQAIIDTTLHIGDGLLNPNTYNKAAWFLHMLRMKVGEFQFTRVLRLYYSTYKYGNASTEDFLNIVNTVTGQNHQEFFHQWLYCPGHPIVALNWNHAQGKLLIEIEQKQKTQLFQFPIEVEIQYPSGDTVSQTLKIDQSKHLFYFEVNEKPLKVEIDPDVKLFFEHF